MKSNFLTAVLNWVLAAVLILGVIFFIQFFFRTRELRTLEPQVRAEATKYQNSHVLLNMLGSDLAEYSKKNPAIKPLLESLAAKANQANPAGTMPVGK